MANDTRIFLTLNSRYGAAIVETFDLGLLRPGLPCTDLPCENKVSNNELFLPYWSFSARTVFPLQIQSVALLSSIY